MNTLAIIGAGYLQLPLVQKAKEMGLRTICFAWSEGAVCQEACDVFYPISITEKEAILSLCRKERVDGVCTIGSDISAPTVAYIAGQLGLPGNRYEAALRANNKYLMRQALTAAGIDCPQYRCVKRGDRIERDSMPMPLIVKPSDRSGSLAVTKVTCPDALLPAVERALEASLCHEAMIEEYIDGREISVEMISSHGCHYALQITDKITTGAPHFVELAHHQPADLTEAMRTAIFDRTRKALDALGLTDGASHSEYKLTSDGRIVVMEIGGRMGGDFIGSHLVPLSTGYDFLRGVIEVALGHRIMPHVANIAHSGVFFLSGETPQVLKHIRKAAQIPCIIAAEQTDRQLHRLTCSGDRSGYFIYQQPEGRYEI